MTRQELEHQAMLLPASERRQLVARLMASLDQAPPDDVAVAWIDEAERRLDDYLAGRASAAPADQVLDEIRRERGWSK